MADESVGSPASAVAVDDTALVSALLALGTMATVTIYYASLGAANEKREVRGARREREEEWPGKDDALVLREEIRA